MRHILPLFFLLPMAAFGQQLPDRSPFGELAHAWNPAMTGLHDYWEIVVDYRQQWLGFDNAPSTATIAAQYPFERENMSIGGVFMHDRIQPLQFSFLGLNYAYRFRMGFTRYDQASIGATVNASQYFVNARDIIVNDPNDQLIPVGESNSLGLNAGAGFFYTTYGGTRRSRYDEENAFYFGGAVQQVFPTELVVEETNQFANWQRTMHGNFLVGGRLVNDKFIIEPSAWLNFGSPNITNVNINVKMEMPEAFWTAVTYSTNQTLALQVGVITLSGFDDASYWRIGMLGSYNISDFGQYRGLGLEAMLAYRFVL